MEEEKFYLTKKGLEKIKKKYQELKKIRKAKSKEGIPQFFQSEEVNPEYLVLQEDLSMLEDQIDEFEKIFKNVGLIKSPPKKNQGIVYLGASVALEDQKGKSNEFQIVGSLEADPSLGKISDESPVGKALIGHKIGDKIIVETAQTKYKIKKIKYKI